MIQPSSIEEYDSLSASLGDKQRAVYEVICDHPGVCNKEIWKSLGWEGVNCVTGRVNELRQIGLVKPIGEYRKCHLSQKATLHWYPECVFHVKPSILKNPPPINLPSVPISSPRANRPDSGSVTCRGTVTAADYKHQLELVTP